MAAFIIYLPHKKPPDIAFIQLTLKREQRGGWRVWRKSIDKRFQADYHTTEPEEWAWREFKQSVTLRKPTHLVVVGSIDVP